MAKTPLTANAHNGHHITQPGEYRKIFLYLTILMGLTIFVAVKVQVPDIAGIKGSGVWINNLIALGIAALKAYLVISIFMGVKYGTKLTKFWAGASFMIFALMFFILADNWTRKNEPAPSWIKDSEGSALPRVAHPLESQELPENELNLRPRQ